MSTEQEDRDLQHLRAEISFGLDAKVFMGSPLGQYLTAKANADIQAALEALAEVDPEDAKAVRKLQNDHKCACNFLLWMGEAVTNGENAERAFVEAEG